MVSSDSGIDTLETIIHERAGGKKGIKKEAQRAS